MIKEKLHQYLFIFISALLVTLGVFLFVDTVHVYGQGQVITPIGGGGGCESCSEYEQIDLCEGKTGMDYINCVLECDPNCTGQGECLNWVPRNPLPPRCEDDDDDGDDPVGETESYGVCEAYSCKIKSCEGLGCSTGMNECNTNADCAPPENTLNVKAAVDSAGGTAITGVSINSSPNTFAGSTSYSKTSTSTITTTLTAPRYHTYAEVQRDFVSWTGCNSANNSQLVRTCSIDLSDGQTRDAVANYKTATLSATLQASPSTSINSGESITFSPVVKGTAVGTIEYPDNGAACGSGGTLTLYNKNNGQFTCQYNQPISKINPSLVVRRGGLQATATTLVDVNGNQITPTPRVDPNITVKKDRGKGTVTSNPARINCNNGCTEQQRSFVYGSTPTLRVVPKTSLPDPYLFNRWDGEGMSGCSGEYCQFTANKNYTFTALFYGPYSLGGPGSTPETGQNITFEIKPGAGDVASYSCGSGASQSSRDNYRIFCNYTTAGYKDVAARVSKSGYSVNLSLRQAVQYPAPKIDSFKTDKDWIRRKSEGSEDSGRATLSWVVRDAVSCRVSGSNLHEQNASIPTGSLQLDNIEETSVYTLTCVGRGEVGGEFPLGARTSSATTRVNVLPVYQEF